MMETVKQYGGDFKGLISKPRQGLYHLLKLGSVVFSALMMWKALCIATGSQSPVVVVLSGSMEPGFYRGDILFLHDKPRINAGDVVVFQVDGRDIPIVHRAMSVHEDPHGEVSILTKGDNNNVDDRGLYARKQLWLNKKHILGVATGYLPYVGMATIWLNDYPWLKWIVVSTMGFFVLVGRE
eukprot:GHVU01004971.1.p1 GENE.GHVU01004971.1~~GHVU01004971.1.p1  ORF type:complete len:182 (+),score=27.67 GHVU01004971.1:161-706(+)